MNIIPQEIQIALSPAVIKFLEDGPASVPELQCFISGFAQCQQAWANDREKLQATIKTLSANLVLVNKNFADLETKKNELVMFGDAALAFVETLKPRKEKKNAWQLLVNMGNALFARQSQK